MQKLINNSRPQWLSVKKLEPLTIRLEILLAQSIPIVLAIDGRAASGKSSLAETLAKDYPTRVIHMDDFFLPQELRTLDRLAEPGGNLHYERFMAEILPFLRDSLGFSYQAFDCSRMQLGEWRRLLPLQLTIVEGTYALHPKFGTYYNLSVFLSCSPKTQLARIKARNSIRFEQFQKHWIPMEETYIKTFGTDEVTDFIIQS